MRRGTLPLLTMALLLLVSCGGDAATPTSACDPAQDTGTCVAPEGTDQPLAEAISIPTVAALPSPTGTSTDSAEEVAYANTREAMVLGQIEARGVSDPDVLAAMRAVPRDRFVPEQYLDAAYADHPLPIGYGQTISQPYMVAWMTELLDLEKDCRVLEIGTGSGYQAAVLAEIVAEVYTVEIVPELAATAQERLSRLGYNNVHVLRADGYWGWEEYAPFDAIIVTAAPDHVPQPLVRQLKEGAHLVIPIGPAGGYQSLWQFSLEEGVLSAQEIGGVRFVPFTREEG